LKVGGDIYYDTRDEDKSTNLLLIAGGVGINPLFSIFQNNFEFLGVNIVADRSTIGKTMLLYSAPSKDELVFKVS
jgi:Flavodoxin reductases (ferredoxin-NADPH reductases) family 1